MRLPSSVPRVWLCVLLWLGGGTVAHAAEHADGAGADLGHRMMVLMLQLAVILCAARIGAFVCKRYLKIPDVLGELGAGILIGPYLLGPHLHLFPAPVGAAFPVTPELYGIATLASIILLYLAGLETDLGMFLRYSVVGSAVGVGGVVVSFVLGDTVAVWTGLADGYLSPAALFLGTISTATSVGITARVLSQRNKLDSPEGVTILAGAVIDDVLGIVILAVVVGMARVSGAGESMAWGRIAMIAVKALGFWIVCTAGGMLLAPRLSKMLEFFGSTQTMATLSLGVALLLAGLSEMAGLAMIIGAYIMGLSLSRVDAAYELRHRLEPVHHTLVGVFFAVMGMMVNLGAMKGMLGVGFLYAFVAMLAKVAGCAIPALLTRFNMTGALRIGVGMLPRGEVTLLIAGIGLSGGFIDARIFGVAVMMTLLSTLIAPLAMVRIFDDRNGLRAGDGEESGPRAEPVNFSLPNQEVAEFVLSRIVQTFEAEECYVSAVGVREPLFQVRKDETTITVRRDGSTIVLYSADETDREFARLVALESVAELISMLEGLRRAGGVGDVRSQLLA